MIANYKIRLAQVADAADIAALSRDLIEYGLGWGWTERRVRRSMHDRATNVAVVREQGQLYGFGIMKYDDDVAHLLLFAVHYLRRRRGVGSQLLSWLEASADTAGIGRIRLEARIDNEIAQSFYLRHGYNKVATLVGYYRGIEDAVRLEKRLRG
jgi:ribosomal-protein-alanine N-acetyltransferase